MNLKLLLKPFREKIDALDDKIVELLVAREKIISEVSNVKYNKNVPACLCKIVSMRCVIMRTTNRALRKAATAITCVRNIYRKIVVKSCVLENQIFELMKTNIMSDGDQKTAIWPDWAVPCPCKIAE